MKIAKKIALRIGMHELNFGGYRDEEGNVYLGPVYRPRRDGRWHEYASDGIEATDCDIVSHDAVPADIQALFGV